MYSLEIALTYLMLKKRSNYFNLNNKNVKLLGEINWQEGERLLQKLWKTQGGKSLTEGSVHLMLEIWQVLNKFYLSRILG